ncbi:MAG: 4'-phosphopantetheinyl transferase superfamily protein [Pseudomonadota bacterium]
MLTEKTINISPFKKRLPRHNQIDLWLFSVGILTDALRNEYENILSGEEHDFCNKIAIQDKKDLFISSKVLLRKLLYCYTSVPASQWRFAINSFGRPCISEPSQYRSVQFNISHAKGLMACSISTFHEVGVDVENISRDRDFLGISRAFFCEREVDSLTSAPSHEVGRMFYTYWTLREAYLKAKGVGLSSPLSSFWFEQVPFPRICFRHECKEAGKRWRFVSKRITDEHILALAIRANHKANINVRVYRAQDHAGKFRVDRSYNIVSSAHPDVT